MNINDTVTLTKLQQLEKELQERELEISVTEKEQGENLAQQLSRFLNVNNQEALKAFVDYMLNEHRYLQNEFNELVFRYLVKCSERYNQGWYDGRNEHTMKEIASMVEQSCIKDYYK